ncbi:MAG: 2-haloalkanoic acid dehalogenase type II [Halieaceae bacterium]
MALKVITFDLDNTLWDVMPALLRAEDAQRRWLTQYRPGVMEDIGHEALWALKKKLWKAHPELSHNVSAMRKLLLSELQLAAGYTPQEAQAGAEGAFGAFLEERQRVEIYAEALQVLESLADRYCLGALTNGNADVYKTDAGEHFDFAFLAEEIGASKPAPDMFHAALECTGASPGEVLHVGDNPEHDVLGALRVGMHAVWVNAEGESWSAVANAKGHAPHGIIRHIRELPDAVVSLEEHLAQRGVS